MDLKQCFNVILKRKYMILIITLAAALVSGIFSYFIINPVYKSDISVIIGSAEKNDNSNGTQTYNDIMMYKQMVKTYSELAQSRAVAKDVIDKLGLDKTEEELLSMVTVAAKTDTEFLTITVKSKDKKECADIANQMAESLKSVSKEVKNADNVQILDKALVPDKPDSPKPLMNIGIAFFIGLMVSIGIAFLIEYLDNTVKDESEIEEITGLPIIGTIPFIKEDDINA